MVRVTQRGVALTNLQGLNRNLAQVSKLQQQLTSGRVITRPSDSPTGTNRAMETRSQRAANDQYARNISDGKTWLDTADGTLTTMLSQVGRVRDLTVQGLNSGSLSPEAAKAVGAEVAQLRTSLLSLANTAVQGRPVFGGVTSARNAYDPVTGAYQGRGGTAAEPAVANTRRISASATVRVEVSGAEAFGDPTQGDDLFAVVDKIASSVVSDPSALSTQLTALDAAISRMTTAVADVGARSARLDTAQQTTADRALTLTSQLAEVEEVDLPKTIMELNMQQVGYQAALSVSAKTVAQSLVDFLR